MTTSTDRQVLVADLLRLLDVQDQGEDRFEGRRRPGGVGRVFGGQAIAQALAAAEATVADDRPAHSLHAYFLRGGSEDHPIDFKVERDLDGGSFSNRRVVASQQNQPILTLIASFHRREDGVRHALPMPDVPPPEDLRSEADLRREHIHLIPESRREFMLRPRPIEQRLVDPRHWMDVTPREPVSHTWFRSVSRLPDDARIHRAVLAYASDMNLLGAALLPHNLSWTLGNLMGVSLDHAVWFHDDFRADDWLLYACDGPWAGGARGFSRGRIYTRDGRLVAETAQEGLLRRITPKD